MSKAKSDLPTRIHPTAITFESYVYDRLRAGNGITKILEEWWKRARPEGTLIDKSDKKNKIIDMEFIYSDCHMKVFSKQPDSEDQRYSAQVSFPDGKEGNSCFTCYNTATILASLAYHLGEYFSIEALETRTDSIMNEMLTSKEQRALPIEEQEAWERLTMCRYVLAADLRRMFGIRLKYDEEMYVRYSSPKRT